MTDRLVPMWVLRRLHLRVYPLRVLSHAGNTAEAQRGGLRVVPATAGSDLNVPTASISNHRVSMDVSKSRMKVVRSARYREQEVDIPVEASKGQGRDLQDNFRVRDMRTVCIKSPAMKRELAWG